MLEATKIAEAHLRCYPWVARVPSEANIADPASRFEVSELSHRGYVQVDPKWPSGWKVNGPDLPTFDVLALGMQPGL